MTPDNPKGFTASETGLEPSNLAIRETAVLLLAADAALCEDDATAEGALAWARKLEASLEKWPWNDGAHSGDCTKQPHTCARCLMEEAEERARQMWDEPNASHRVIEES